MASINESIMAQLQSMEQSMSEQMAVVAEMRKTLGLGPIEAAQSSGKKAKKPKKAAKSSDGAEAPPKAPSAWNQLVSQTVAEMKQSGWESWTTVEGVVWPAAKRGMVKDKKGAESEQWVYDGGEHDGKQPSPALGGMVRASYLKAQSDPEHAAKAAAYRAGLAAKRSQSGSVGSGAAEEPVADAAEAGKKSGRPKMTEEQKAAAKVKRDAKKAAAAAPVILQEQDEFEEDAEDGSQTPALPPPPPKAAVGGGGAAAAPAAAAPAATKKFAKKAPKPLDLNFRPWTHDGQSYYKNERGDVLSSERDWLGRFNGSEIQSVEEPEDLGEATVEDEE